MFKDTPIVTPEERQKQLDSLALMVEDKQDELENLVKQVEKRRVELEEFDKEQERKHSEKTLVLTEEADRLKKLADDLHVREANLLEKEANWEGRESRFGLEKSTVTLLAQKVNQDSIAFQNKKDEFALQQQKLAAEQRQLESSLFLLKAKEEACTQQDKANKLKEVELDSRSQSLTTRDEELRALKATLEDKEKGLKVKETELQSRESLVLAGQEENEKEKNRLLVLGIDSRQKAAEFEGTKEATELKYKNAEARERETASKEAELMAWEKELRIQAANIK